MSPKYFSSTTAAVFLLEASLLRREELLPEAEAFARQGNWKLDTQFIELMGSPYLLAHGMGNPVGAAAGEFSLTEGGSSQVWVRIVDWPEQVGRGGRCRPLRADN